MLKEIETGDGVTWKAGRGAADAKWNGSDWVAVWHHRKWGDEDLVVYQIANDKIAREEKIWPAVVKYFDRDWQRRYLKKYPKEKDSYTFRADDPDVVTFEFKDHKLLLNFLPRTNRISPRAPIGARNCMGSGTSTRRSSRKSISSRAKLVFGTRKSDAPGLPIVSGLLTWNCFTPKTQRCRAGQAKHQAPNRANWLTETIRLRIPCNEVRIKK